MIDAERMLGSLVRNAMGGGHGGYGGRGRKGRKRKRGRRGSMLGGAGKGALALGALGVAMAAFEHFSEKKTATPAPAGAGAPPPLPSLPTPAAAPSATAGSEPPPLPPLPTTAPERSTAPAAARDDALLLVRAMIAAANADHELDDAERQRILAALDDAEASEEDKEFLRRELEDPIDLSALAAACRTPKLANQIYLASCLAIEIDTRAERNYLERLATRLGLDPEKARELESMAGGEDGEPQTEA